MLGYLMKDKKTFVEIQEELFLSKIDHIPIYIQVFLNMYENFGNKIEKKCVILGKMSL